MHLQMSILESGERETLKAAVHALALALAAFIGLYNLTAWLQRREDHLAVNTVVYAALVLFECRHVKHHWTAGAESSATAALLVAAASAAHAASEAFEKRAA